MLEESEIDTRYFVSFEIMKLLILNDLLSLDNNSVIRKFFIAW